MSAHTRDLVLVVTDIETNFHTNEGIVKAVRFVSLEIERGKTVGVVGESGLGQVDARTLDPRAD